MTGGITKWQILWDTPCSSTRMGMLLSGMPWYSWDRKTCWLTVRVTGVISSPETVRLLPVISRRVYPSLRWMLSSIPKLPNGNCHTTDEIRNQSLFLWNSRYYWRREWKVSPLDFLPRYCRITSTNFVMLPSVTCVERNSNYIPISRQAARLT